MSLQDIFYITAIIFMTLAVIILIGIVVVLFYIKLTIDNIHKAVDEQLDKVKHLTSHPAEIARESSAVVGKVITSLIARKKKS